MATYRVSYTLPGELGKVRIKTFKSAVDRDTGLEKLRKQGAKIKTTERING